MGTQDYSVRRMMRDEVDLMVDWAYDEGWNPGLYDASVFYQTDPSGFWAGELDGEIVSMMSGVSYDAAYGFTGLYITQPDYRGQGYGRRLWNQVHSQMGERVLGSDGVGPGTAMLQKGGYVAAHLNVHFEGKAEQYGPNDPNVLDVKHIPFERLDEYDRETFAARQSRFLRGWISRPGTTGVAYLHDGKMHGYGVIRPCRIGWKIGPLFANNEVVADKLFESLANRVHPGDTLFLDVPEPNKRAPELARRYGMSPITESTRMYRNGAHKSPLERWYGVTTNELG